MTDKATTTTDELCTAVNNEPCSLLDDLFHRCAMVAYLDETTVSHQFPPDQEATRRRAYRYYEEALAAKNESRQDSEAA